MLHATLAESHVFQHAAILFQVLCNFPCHAFGLWFLNFAILFLNPWGFARILYILYFYLTFTTVQQTYLIFPETSEVWWSPFMS